MLACISADIKCVKEAKLNLGYNIPSGVGSVEHLKGVPQLCGGEARDQFCKFSRTLAG